MRRYLAGICVAAAVAGGAATAWAAIPPTNRQFGGSGGMFWNQSGHWVHHGTRGFSFRTSGPGFYRYVNQFHSTYTARCHPGTTLKMYGNNILIHKNGTFSFSFVSHGAHARIWGTFTGNGTSANVNYLVNFGGSNTNPNGLHSSCATWVHGVAHAK